MKRLALLLLMLAGACASRPALAVSCTTSAQAVAFGNYDPLSLLDTTAVGNVSVTCTNLVSLLVSYSVALSTGISGNYASREMASGANRLNYNLYKDPAHLLVWGTGADDLDNTFLVVLLGITANHPVYGKIPAQQGAAVGSYSDTITVTVTY